MTEKIELWIFSAGLVAGALGYLIATFWFEPILQFHRIRHSVTSDLVFYANSYVYPPEPGSTNIEVRQVAIRRHAAELIAIYGRLPAVYRVWLKVRGQDPSRAAVEIMGWSNAVLHEQAEPRVRSIEKALGIGRVV